MSTDNALILEVIPSGKGTALDLGGGRGDLRQPLEKLGYQYVNLDTRKFENGEPTVVGDAHTMPFEDASFDLVVSKDTLEHFLDPFKVVQEVDRVLKPGGLFVICVPWMHPFHGDDYWRYSPVGLKHLLKDFEIVSFDNPSNVITAFGTLVIVVMRRVKLGCLEQPIKKGCRGLDKVFNRFQKCPSSFAAAYRLVTQKPGVIKEIQ